MHRVTGDPYAVLGVRRDATDSELRAAWEVRVTAAAKAGDLAGAQRVDAAYEVLRHPSRRAAYDRTGEVLWTLFFSDSNGEPVLSSVIDGAMNEMDLDLMRRYAEVTAAVGAMAVLVAVIRRDGQPRREDLQLWRDLRVLLDSETQLLEFVVVGLTSDWATTRDGDFGTAA